MATCGKQDALKKTLGTHFFFFFPKLKSANSKIFVSSGLQSHIPSYHRLSTTLTTKKERKKVIQKSKHRGFNCQDYSRARVHFQSLLCGFHPTWPNQNRHSSFFPHLHWISTLPQFKWLTQREVVLLDPQRQIFVKSNN